MIFTIKDNKLKDKIPAFLWYKYFYKSTEFKCVKLPIVKKRFT
jgi:hypothetical protein